MSDAKSPSRPIAQSPSNAAMRLDIIPERPCVPVGEVTSLPVLARLLSPAYCQLPPARCLDRDRVILLTDGQANHGIIDPAVLVKHAAELTEEGIATTTLGYDEQFK